jgi:hypothetical protein
MNSDKQPESDQLVPHPQYGGHAKVSGYSVDVATLRKSHWQYAKATIYPESAIPARTELQKFASVARTWYVDILKTCVDCRRQFIFFAEEQRYWYEELQFDIGSDCVRCPECRKSARELKRRHKRYSALISRKDLGVEDLVVLISDILYLSSEGVHMNERNVRRVKNYAVKVMPGDAATVELVTWVDSLREGS